MRKAAKISLSVLTLALLVALFCPKPDLYSNVSFSTAVVDRHGELMRLSLADDQRYRLHTPFTEIPQSLRDATLAYEDRYFYSHPGVNVPALIRAAWTSVLPGSRKMGASTITMQLARLRYSLNTRSIRGKLVQIIRALQFERHYSKTELLEAYLNLAPYGGNIEGAGAAALIYFDKPLAKINELEAATLAVIPQNPSARNPVGRRGQQAILEARQRLADRLISADRAALALPIGARDRQTLPFHAPHLATRLLSNANGNVINSTIDLASQQALEAQIARFLARHRQNGLDNAAALLVDHRSMEVRASVGSASFFADAIAGQVDGTQARRSPGSALKPFIYGLALDRGLIHPMSLLKDTPTRYQHYTPENFDRGFRGPISARDALVYSRNVPAIRLLSELGIDSMWELLDRSGVEQLKSAEHYGLALALGGNEITMRELVTLYAALANGGAVKKLRDRRGEPQRTVNRILSPEASFLVLDMLAANPRPNRLSLGEPETAAVSWKTGTSYANRDAWSVGVIGPYVLAVWVGHFDGRPNPSLVGRRVAAPLFFQITDALGIQDETYTPSMAKLNVRTVDICLRSGELAGRHCPQSQPSWFIPGKSPIRSASIFREVRIDKTSGLRSCRQDHTTAKAVYEFWPSDIRAVFERAGIATRRPPEWDPGCEHTSRVTQAASPQITSPAEHLMYIRDTSVSSVSTLALDAVADDEARQLFWFVDRQFVGASEPGKPLAWNMQAGRHQLRVVDDLGLQATRIVDIASSPTTGFNEFP